MDATDGAPSGQPVGEEGRRRAVVREVTPGATSRSGGASPKQVCFWVAEQLADESRAAADRLKVAHRVFCEEALILLLSKRDDEIRDRIGFERDTPGHRLVTYVAPELARETRVAARRFGVKIGVLAQIALEDFLVLEDLLAAEEKEEGAP